MEKHCSECNRPVKETVHTSQESKIDYFEKNTDGRGAGKIVCIDCEKKKK